MSVGVDESGCDRTAGKPNGFSPCSRADVNDSAVFDDQAAFANRWRGDRTNPIGFEDRHAEKTCDRTVSRSMRSSLTLNPMPGPRLCRIRPSAEISTSGSMMSSDQYRLLADTSPGSEKFSRLESAMFWARPTPDSS